MIYLRAEVLRELLPREGRWLRRLCDAELEEDFADLLREGVPRVLLGDTEVVSISSVADLFGVLRQGVEEVDVQIRDYANID